MDPGPVDAIRAKKPKRLPTVLSREEARVIITALSGTNQLIARLLYGSGLRLIECLRLRVKACPERSEGTLILPTARPVLSLSKHHRA